MSAEDLKLKVMRLGGKFATKITNQTTAIIAQPGNITLFAIFLCIHILLL